MSGFVLSLFDHIANNYGVRTGNSLATFMNGIGAHGYLVLDLFFAGVLVVVAADLYVVHLMVPRLPARNSPTSSQDFRGTWLLPVGTRALAHAAFQNRHSPRVGRARATGTAASPRPSPTRE
jgi:hypothetical protein